MANKIRIEILGNELRLSQYADDTNLFYADLASVEKAWDIVENFGSLVGLKLNRKKQKWSGWENRKMVKAIHCNWNGFAIRLKS